VIQCRPADPETKGLVERANGYFETSFLPGREFCGPGDFNAQLTEWLVRANTRQHRVLGCRPADRWDADRAAMLELPPVAPVVGWRAATRLPRDHYVRLDSNDYSVHPAVIGRKVEVGADLDQVIVTCQGKVVATHVRCWADHQTLTDPVHAEAAAGLRQARRLSAVHPVDTLVEQRELTDYDRMLGVTSEGVA
jgi:transposase